jgi:3'-phosphoadenosine 5'-phosphosulfate sulfotransferase (PAPS reductase)/FAD synthetase
MGKFNWINVSGGKDSTALLLWSIEQEMPNPRYVYADTKHEHPAVYEYLTYLETKLNVKIERVESEGFLEMCKRKQRFPSAKARFCTEELKIKPLARYMDKEEDNDADNPHNVWVGVRREESSARATLPESMFRNYSYPPRITSYEIRHHPLLDWFVDDVFAIHKKHGIEPNPLYKMGMGRVGCFPCIMAKRSELKRLFKACPEVIDRLEDWEAQVAAASKRGGATWVCTSDLPEGVPHGIRAFAGYLDAGPELPGLEEEPGGCMSVYGLCE